MNLEQRQHHSLLAVNLGLAANAILAILKTTFGILGHSEALLADGINSTSDVVYYIIVRIFMSLSRKPADDEHPYGHSQLESIAALVVGSFVITTAIAIFWDAINNVFDLLSGASQYEGASIYALLVALLTVLVKICLTIYTRRIGKETGNPAVAALAYDHRNDILSASGAAIGIFLGRAGLPWVDPLAGALVAMVILRTGIEILRESAAELMDAIPGNSLAEQIDAIVEQIPGVKQVESLRAHRFGPYLVVNITIGIDGALSVEAGDRIASLVERSVRHDIAFIRTVYVHYHPARTASAAAE